MRRFLIDECLSKSLVAVCKQRGMDATHVGWIGRAGMDDWALTAFAVGSNYAIVTNNRRDFLRHYSRIDVHDGLLVIVPMLEREDQLRVMRIALDHIATLDDTVNQLLEVFSDGSVRVTPWSAEDHSRAYIDAPGRTP